MLFDLGFKVGYTRASFLWQVSLTMLICSCVWTPNFLWQVFPWQVLFAGVNELTSFPWQVFTIASNTIAQWTRKKTTTRRQFRFFTIAHAYLTREKRLLACAVLIWALEETYESEVVGSPSGNAKTKSVSRFCKLFRARTKRRRWGTFSQLFPFTSIRY